MDLLRALVLGLVEGATEFMPVSSTGHLILVGHWLAFTGERVKVFEVVIQVGAILAIVWLYRGTFVRLALGWPRDAAAQRLLRNLAIAFLPAALVGFLAHRLIQTYLFDPRVVAWALVVGGVVMLIVERQAPPPRIATVDELPPRAALGIGIAQVLALIPGVSRSAATIMGGLGLGLSRPAATEFSFFLAVPVILAAGAFDLVANLSLLSVRDVPLFAVGLTTSFVSALIVVQIFVRFVSRHRFTGFAWYRIVVGALLLALLTWGPARP